MIWVVSLKRGLIVNDGWLYEIKCGRVVNIYIATVGLSLSNAFGKE